MRIRSTIVRDRLRRRVSIDVTSSAFEHARGRQQHRHYVGRSTRLGDQPRGVDSRALLRAAVATAAGINDKVDTAQVECAHLDNIRQIRKRGTSTRTHDFVAGITKCDGQRRSDLAQCSHDDDPHLGTFSW